MENLSYENKRKINNKLVAIGLAAEKMAAYQSEINGLVAEIKTVLNDLPEACDCETDCSCCDNPPDHYDKDEN